jgi:hypothetical protein
VDIVMDSDKNVVCNFRGDVSGNVTYYMLTVIVEPTGSGEVKIEPDVSNKMYEVNSVVSLYAEADEGYKFVYWYGDISGVDNPVDIVIDRDKVVVCKFEKVEDTGEVNNKMYGYKVRSYPNPFIVKKDVVEIRFKLDDVKDVRDIEVVVYDSLGRVVKELEVGDKGEGRYMSIWDGKDKENNYVKSGIYFCKVKYKNKKDMYTKIVCVK